MSQFVPPRPRRVGARRTYAIVASSYNPEFVQGLVDHAAEEFNTLSPNSHLLLHQVPGAFEIPLIVQEMASRPSITAVVALGVIIRGQTAHADLVGRAVTDALLRISLETRTPVIHEVLLVESEEQARERCLSNTINRGAEAARAAVEMAELCANLQVAQPASG